MQQWNKNTGWVTKHIKKLKKFNTNNDSIPIPARFPIRQLDCSCRLPGQEASMPWAGSRAMGAAGKMQILD